MLLVGGVDAASRRLLVLDAIHLLVTDRVAHGLDDDGGVFGAANFQRGLAVRAVGALAAAFGFAHPLCCHIKMFSGVYESK